MCLFVWSYHFGVPIFESRDPNTYIVGTYRWKCVLFKTFCFGIRVWSVYQVKNSFSYEWHKIQLEQKWFICSLKLVWASGWIWLRDLVLLSWVWFLIQFTLPSLCHAIFNLLSILLPVKMSTQVLLELFIPSSTLREREREREVVGGRTDRQEIDRQEETDRGRQRGRLRDIFLE